MFSLLLKIFSSLIFKPYKKTSSVSLIVLCLVTKCQEKQLLLSHAVPDSSLLLPWALQVVKHVHLGELPCFFKDRGTCLCHWNYGQSWAGASKNGRTFLWNRERPPPPHCSLLWGRVKWVFKMSVWSWRWPWPSHGWLVGSSDYTMREKSTNYFPTCGWSQENNDTPLFKGIF